MIHYITSNGLGNAWVGNELRVLDERGIPFVHHAMRPPHQYFFQSEWAERLHAGTRRIYPLPPLRLALSLLVAPLLFRGRFLSALGNGLFGQRESLRARVAALAHLAVACHWARGLRHEDVTRVHAQWIHSCGTIGMYGAWLLDVPFGFTGHATDLFRDRVALRDKVRRADWIVCISSFHRDLFRELGAAEEKLEIVYCGIDVRRFSPSSSTGVQPAERRPFRILSSGRLVEKKGFPDLVEACRILVDRGIDLECIIAGSGPDEDALRARVRDAGLEERVRITGEAVAQENLPQFLRSGDVYCLPCVWARDGDVDGLPQMLMEAMACGLPVVSTRLVGIPDLVGHEETGLLCEPGAPRDLAGALDRLRTDRDLARRLAEAGRTRVVQSFDIETCLEPLIRRFRDALTGREGRTKVPVEEASQRVPGGTSP